MQTTETPPEAVAAIPDEVGYVALLFTLFVVPRFLQRFGIPSALTSLVFGAIAGLGFGLFQHNPTIELLSTLGIVALFLFAGLDVEVRELRQEAWVLSEHVAARIALVAAVAWGAGALLGIDVRMALLVSLALLTPSTGFILDSLDGWGLEEKERFWIRSKAIATELVALVMLFVVLQSTSLSRLGLAAAALIGMIAILPVIFRWFASAVIPYAPKSEFGFLMMVAVVCALVTRSLGVYYLVGAFVVGMAAQQFRLSLPSLSSARMLATVEAFASLFVPFYFFHAGLLLAPEYFTVQAFAWGVGFAVVALPLRLSTVVLHRKIRFGEGIRHSLRVGVPMLPTTVFTLVLVQILGQRFGAPPFLLGALVIYMVMNTIAPALLIHKPVADFDDELMVGAEKTSGVVSRFEGNSSFQNR